MSGVIAFSAHVIGEKIDSSYGVGKLLVISYMIGLSTRTKISKLFMFLFLSSRNLAERKDCNISPIHLTDGQLGLLLLKLRGPLENFLQGGASFRRGSQYMQCNK